ncbi:hypothetical protein BJY01DRAFT_195717 [Aspergillus pseudoustus]|uniref:Zn(2)-C6 fungal-type domain-containing protein n=1 Tax=Aspergillus pseudoustus TaxID=1810923 RepID=A0ABR4KUE8_9EURO
MSPPKRRRKSSKRSLTGCRTCRARHIKCDEGPGECNNCTSTGRTCDGYDLARLPVERFALAHQPKVATRLAWLTTTDEKRCFSYFMNHSIPSLSALFDQPLWQKTAMQLSHVDRAVYHAANMLGALHEDSEENQMRLFGENLNHPRHRFALEQASRSFEILHRRQASNDPQLREVMLLCCLLFVISDLLLGRYDNALEHLRGGLRILQEAQKKRQPRSIPEVDGGLVKMFQRLDVEYSHFGPGKPFFFASDELEDGWFVRRPLHTLDDVRDSVTRLLNLGIPFLAKCWPLTEADIGADYFDLHRTQERLLSLYYSLRDRIQALYDRPYPRLSYKEQRGLALSKLQCLSQILGIKTCLIDGPLPASWTPEFVGLLSAHQDFLAKFSERPTITMDYGIIPGLYVVTKCPYYLVRLQAIDILLSWPHREAVVNSNVVASLALETLKVEMQATDRLEVLGVDDEAAQALNSFLSNTLKSTPRAVNWSTIQASKIIPRSENS